MTTSTPNEPSQDESGPNETGGMIADGLTVIRALITPIIMVIIVKGWPLPGYALLASIVFIGAALTDIFDDYFGGAETAIHRKFDLSCGAYELDDYRADYLIYRQRSPDWSAERI